MAIDLQTANIRLGIAFIAERPGDGFETLGKVPDWLHAFDPDIAPGRPFSLERTFLFFNTYLEEVREVLARDPSAMLNSGPWSESDRGGRERHLSAISSQLEGRLMVQLKLIDQGQLYHQAVFQKAREYSLNYERLVKERDRKEALLHTIVHDLAGPLTAITGALEMLAAGKTRRRSAEELVKIALNQCRVEQSMIKSILESFAAELGSFDADTLSYAAAPDALACATEVVAGLVPAFLNDQVDLRVQHDLGGDAVLKVVADEEALRRVIANLLENALRYSPPHTQVTVGIAQDDDRVRITVSDEGQGVEEAFKATLFDRFIGGRRQGGKIGLGLYFCRITVERWGGRIGYEARTGQPGTRFWFELRRVSANQ